MNDNFTRYKKLELELGTCDMGQWWVTFNKISLNNIWTYGQHWNLVYLCLSTGGRYLMKDMWRWDGVEVIMFYTRSFRSRQIISINRHLCPVLLRTIFINYAICNLIRIRAKAGQDFLRSKTCPQGPKSRQQFSTAHFRIMQCSAPALHLIECNKWHITIISICKVC